MSDTPRTDAFEEAWKMRPAPNMLRRFARALESELNAAQLENKRLTGMLEGANIALKEAEAKVVAEHQRYQLAHGEAVAARAEVGCGCANPITITLFVAYIGWAAGHLRPHIYHQQRVNSYLLAHLLEIVI